MDIQQFLPTFIEETSEMLQQMEQALLEIEINAPDPEKLNLIFRVMHSIKSGSAAFGLNNISKFSHALESLLQKIRDGKHKLNNVDVNLLFSTIDYLRTALDNIKNNQPIDEALAEKIIQSALEAGQGNDTPITSKPLPEEKSITKTQKAENTTKITEKKQAAWNIRFTPEPALFQTGNDPLALFRTLKKLGTFTIEANLSHIPTLEKIDPSLCYFSWNIQLTQTQTTQKELEEAFSWITTPETLQITPLEYSENKKTLPEIPIPIQTHEKTPFRTSIRVATDKIDRLMNTVGELVITKSTLSQLIQHAPEKINDLQENLSHLERNVRELQESITRIRMVPISFAFERVPRLIHTMAEKMKKQVQLTITGEETELDKIVMEKITDPILHLIRNAIDHGIELPHIREKMGKPPTGTIALNAYQEGSNIIIEIQDDGGGLNKTKIRRKAIEKGLLTDTQEISDEQIYQFIFQPAFSTAEKITEISGRGVGLDVVYQNLLEVGGKIDVQCTPDKGSIFRLRIPLTLTIMDCQLISVNQEKYLIPLASITELLKIDSEKIQPLDTQTQVYAFRGEYIPMIYLDRALCVELKGKKANHSFLMIVEFSKKLYGLVCDALLEQHQVVIKNIEENYHKVQGISGACILGDGKVAFIIDISTIILSTIQPHKIGHIVRREAEKTPPEKKSVDPLQKIQFLSFFIANQEYAINISDILGIESLSNITAIPNTPSYIKGMMNLHGVIAPVINLQERLSLNIGQSCSSRPIIILNLSSGDRKKIFGIMVDAVNQEFTCLQRDIKPAPEGSQTTLSNHILGITAIKDKMITLLKIDDFIDFQDNARKGDHHAIDI